MMTVTKRVALLLGVLLCTQLGAQDFKSAKRVFDKDIKSDSLASRLSAVKVMSECGDPKGVKVLVERVSKETKALEKLRKEYRKLGVTIHELALKMVDKGGGTQEDMKRYEEKVKPLRDKQDKLSTAINDNERVSRALMEGTGSLISSLDGEPRSEGVQELLKLLSRRKRGEARQDMIQILGRVNVPEARSALHELVLRSDNDTEQVVGLEALVHHAAEESEPVAIKVIGASSWQVRAAALRLLRVVGAELAIPAVIERLAIEKGRLIGDVIRTLEHLTGQSFNDNVHLWREWWRKAKEAGWDHRGGQGVDRAGGGHGEGGARQGDAKGIKDTGFFGIRTRSKNIIYVLDISGSMLAGVSTPPPAQGAQPPPVPVGQRKIDTAIHELVSSVSSLPEDGSFNVVFYSSDIETYKKKMVTSNKKQKARLKSWSEDVEAQGMTNIFDALEKAFEIAGRGTFDKGYKSYADTIFFLSDGVCNRGRVQKPVDMLREVGELNKLKKLQIHCVALGLGADVRFMQALAKQSGGQFAHITK